MFCYVLLVAIYCSKIVLLPLHLDVGISWCILSMLASRMFLRCFGMSCFVYCVTLSRYLFNLSSFAIIFWFLSCSCIDIFLVLLFPFCYNMFRRFSFVLSFLLVVVDFLSAFPVEFPIQVLNFWSCFLVNQPHLVGSPSLCFTVCFVLCLIFFFFFFSSFQFPSICLSFRFLWSARTAKLLDGKCLFSCN